MTDELPPQPDFAALAAAAPDTADRRTRIFALVGHIVFSWSNTESLFIYVLMLLLGCKLAPAAMIFATLNTSRARTDLILRLAKTRVSDQEVYVRLTRIVSRFQDVTKFRNEFNHCMYSVNERGEITHTQSMRIIEKGTSIRFGEVREMDDDRLKELEKSIAKLGQLNRDIWEFLPVLKAAVGHQESSFDPKPPVVNDPGPDLATRSDVPRSSS